jgi:hypothetical protein
VKAAFPDVIHKITNGILCSLSNLHMGIMNCKLVKVSHTEHQQDMLKNKSCLPECYAGSLGKEFPMLQTITVLSSFGSWAKALQPSERSGTTDPLIRHHISENLNLQRLCCENFSLIHLWNVYGISRNVHLRPYIN